MVHTVSAQHKNYTQSNKHNTVSRYVTHLCTVGCTYIFENIKSHLCTYIRMYIHVHGMHAYTHIQYTQHTHVRARVYTIN